MEIKGAIALVTGGAQGLGLAIATKLANDGASVIVADCNKSSLSLLPAHLHGLYMNVTDIIQVKKALKDIIKEFGHINILVNNAGKIFSKPFVDVMNPEFLMHDYESFRNQITANLDSVFIVTTGVVEHMIRLRTKGVIINISSISSIGNEGQTAYSAAKAGVNAMTRTWSKELGRMGIRCNVISPGFIDTPSTRSSLSDFTIKHIQSNTPLRRLGYKEEVAQAVASLINNDYINGAILDVNGGLSI